jgi:hypothetical protein
MKTTTSCFKIFIIFMLSAGVLCASNLNGKKGQDFYFFPSKTVVIDSTTNGDVLVFGGDVLVIGKINGNLSVVKGSVSLKKGSIEGDVVVVGGTLTTDNVGKVKGSKVVLASIIKNNKMIMLLFSSIFWLITIGFAYLFFPENVKENAFEFSDDFIRAFFLGLYSSLLLLFMMFISFVLVKVVVGIFLFVAMAAMVFALYVFSLLTIFYFLGEIILKRFFSANIPGLLFMIVGLIIYQSLSFFGIIGFVVDFIMISGAIGATILSRFGTFKSWFGIKRHWV